MANKSNVLNYPAAKSKEANTFFSNKLGYETAFLEQYIRLEQSTNPKVIRILPI